MSEASSIDTFPAEKQPTGLEPIAIGTPSHVKDFIGPRGIAFMPVMGKKQIGRPTVVTQDVLSKLEEAFAWGSSDERACAYADISTSTLYRYEEAHPEFRERKQALKLRPDISAQKKLSEDAGTSTGAQWWANHRMRDEFASTQKVELEGSVTTRAEMTPEVAKVIEEMNAKMREAIAAPHKPTP